MNQTSRHQSVRSSISEGLRAYWSRHPGGRPMSVRSNISEGMLAYWRRHPERRSKRVSNPRMPKPLPPPPPAPKPRPLTTFDAHAAFCRLFDISDGDQFRKRDLLVVTLPHP